MVGWRDEGIGGHVWGRDGEKRLDEMSVGANGKRNSHGVPWITHTAASSARFIES